MSMYKKYLAEFTREASNLVVHLDDFEYGDTIGKGGFGEVKRAIQKKTGRECAVKTIYNERLEGNKLRRYIGEIETMANCDNLFLVPFVGFTATPPYAVVTEFMPNGSLDRFVRNREGYSLSGTQLTAIAMGIAYGMIHLHSKGIIHRDLKAANIMLDARLFPKIGDFGIARFEEYEGGMTAKIGTPNYMAPELIESHDYDAKVDVYSYAMILYEMTQNVRPFKAFKMSEIFQAVLEDDFRPELIKPVPEGLSRLINECWAKDPEDRPTFEEVYDRFQRGEAFFTGTRRRDIEKFIETIKHDESRRAAAALKRKSHKTRSSDDYYSTDYSNETFHNFNDDGDWHPKHPVAGLSDEEEEYEEEEEEEESSSQQPGAILLDPKHPAFARTVMSESEQATTATFFKFYRPIGVHLTRRIPSESLAAIVRACLGMMRRDAGFVPLFNQAQFFVFVPTDNPLVVDDVVDCFAQLFTRHPKLVNNSHCAPVTELLTRRPEKMLILHSFYVRQLLSFRNPWPILDNLLTVQKVLLNKPGGDMYLALFSFLIKKYELYAKERAVHVRGIFILFLGSRVDANVRAAYNGLSTLFKDYTGIDFTRLAGHLRHETLWRPALSLLLRVEKPPATPEIVHALLSVAKNAPKAWIVLLRIAVARGGARLFVEDRSWASLSKRHPADVARLLLALFLEPSARAPLAQAPEFVEALRAMAAKKDAKVQSAIAALVRRTTVTPELLGRLGAAGFLAALVDEAQKTSKPKKRRAMLQVVDHLARGGYTDEFIAVIPAIVAMLSEKEIAGEALTVIVSLSFHPKCAQAMRTDELRATFEDLAKFEEYRDLAVTFLANTAK